jgi:hypothetical protein
VGNHVRRTAATTPTAGPPASATPGTNTRPFATPSTEAANSRSTYPVADLQVNGLCGVRVSGEYLHLWTGWPCVVPSPTGLLPDGHLHPAVQAPQLPPHPQQGPVVIVYHLRPVAPRVVREVPSDGLRLSGRRRSVVVRLAARRSPTGHCRACSLRTRALARMIASSGVFLAGAVPLVRWMPFQTACTAASLVGDPKSASWCTTLIESRGWKRPSLGT